MFANQMNRNVEVKYFVMVQTGTYQEQHLRPFNVNVTNQNINDLIEVTNEGRNLGVSAVQEIASNIIAPTANTEGITNIAEGWSSRRFRFMMVVEEKHAFIQSSTTQRILFGYTDHCDASFNHLDPNMRIYFNSETVINNDIVNTPAGPVLRSRMLSSNQIVSPVDVTQNPITTFQSPTTHLVRPEDVFSVAQSTAVGEQLMASGRVPGVIEQTFDNRTLSGLGNEYRYSRRQHSSPVRYLSEALGSYQHAVREIETSFDDSLSGAGVDVLLGEASSHSRNDRMSSNTFLSMLRDHCGYFENGHVTLSQIQQLFPETASDQVTKYALDNGQSIRKVSQTADSQVWSGADNDSIAASLIAQTTPSVMMDTLFRSISFSVTNGHGPNQYIVEINPHMTKTVTNMSTDLIQRNIMEFERRIKVDILNLISRGNNIPFSLIVSSDLAGDTIIDLSLDGGAVERFVAPTFGDALFAPVITRDLNLVKALSSDMTFLMGQIIKPAHTQSIENLYGSNMGQMNVPDFVNYQAPQMSVTSSPNFNQGQPAYVDLGLL